MTRFIARRIGLAVVTLLLIVTAVFFILNVLPDDPARRIAGPFAQQEQVDIIAERIGTNDPISTQYLRILQNTATFDFGTSFTFNQPVRDILFPDLWRSAKLVILALVITIPISIAAGVYAARRKDTLADRSIVTLGLASASIPEFVSAAVLQYLIGVRLGWLPALALAPSGSSFFVEFEHLLLPALALSVVYFGYIARITRNGAIRSFASDYVRTAYMKGLGRGKVVRRHVLRNALQETVTVIGVAVGYLFGGLVALEIVFNYPGLGRRIFVAAGDKDYPILTAGVILIALVYMVFTLLADLTVAWMNPRSREELGH